MFEIRIRGVEKINPYEELIKVFLPPDQFRLVGDEVEGETEDIPDEAVTRLTYDYCEDPYVTFRRIYRDLSRATGKAPKWGVLTGIRPVKLVYELAWGAKKADTQAILKADYEDYADFAGYAHPDAGSLPANVGHVGRADARDDAVDQAVKALEKKYLVHPSKAELAAEILRYQKEQAGDPQENSLSVYLGIPFCPTRCLYCSFTSNQVGEEEIVRYLGALEREIDRTAEAVLRQGMKIESFYIGGGTPTTLSAGQLDRLLQQIRQRFDLDRQPLREFTVEAGRPDTVTAEKLAVLKEHGIERISINPQSMQQATLDLIGRRHTVEQTRQAYALAKEAQISCINTDLIAGLPGEDFPAFAESLDEVLELGADNITLHTLAVKRASRLKDMDENYHYREQELREEMLRYAEETLRAKGFRPYYLYRQKHTSGNTENIGYCREDKLSVYNIRIMEERQSILALGAGGISKRWYSDENRLERVPNVSNYEIYIDRIDEMIERKDRKFFGRNDEKNLEE